MTPKDFKEVKDANMSAFKQTELDEHAKSVQEVMDLDQESDSSGLRRTKSQFNKAGRVRIDQLRCNSRNISNRDISVEDKSKTNY